MVFKRYEIDEKNDKKISSINENQSESNSDIKFELCENEEEFENINEIED